MTRKSAGVVVVTGAGAGAGRAIARRFASEGWRVGLISRDADRLETARCEVQASGGEALVLPTDVSDATAVFAARDAVVERFGGIDAWVNDAMVTVVGPVAVLEPSDVRRVMETTFLGCVHGTMAALQAMRPAGRGSIVQIGSALAYRAIPLQSAYCAAKFAIRGFTDSLRTELEHEGSDIRVSMLQMPAMNTPQFDWARNHLKHKYKPVGEIFDPQVAGEAAWRAVRDGPRELWVGGSSVQAILGQLFCPPLLDRMMAGEGWSGQVTDEPEPPGRPDNLDAPVNADVGARGRFGAQAKPHAFVVDGGVARLGVAGLASLAMGAVAGAAFMAGRAAGRTD